MELHCLRAPREIGQPIFITNQDYKKMTKTIKGMRLKTPYQDIEISPEEVQEQSKQPESEDNSYAEKKYAGAIAGLYQKLNELIKSCTKRLSIAEENTEIAREFHKKYLSAPLTKKERDEYMPPWIRFFIHLLFVSLILIVLAGGITQIDERLSSADIAGARNSRASPWMKYIYPFTLLFVSGMCSGLLCYFIQSQKKKRALGIIMALTCMLCIGFTALTKSMSTGEDNSGTEGDTARRRTEPSSAVQMQESIERPIIRFFKEEAPSYVLFTSFIGEVSGTGALKIAWYLTLVGYRTTNRNNSPETQRNRDTIQKSLEAEAEEHVRLAEYGAEREKIKMCEDEVCKAIVTHLRATRDFLRQIEEAETKADGIAHEKVVEAEAAYQESLRDVEAKKAIRDAAKSAERDRHLETVEGDYVPAARVRRSSWDKFKGAAAAALATLAALLTLNSCSEPQEQIVIPSQERDTIAIYVSNELPDDAARDEVYKLVSDLALNKVGLGDTVLLFDGVAGPPIAEFAIPQDTLFEHNGRFREELFEKELQAMDHWLAQDPPNQERPLALNIPEIFRAASTLGLDETDHLVLIGSAQFRPKAKDISWSMEWDGDPDYPEAKGGYIPPDSSIVADPIANGGCLYSQKGREGLMPCSVHWIYLQDDFPHTLYRRACERYWAASVAYTGGKLRSAEVSVDTVLPRLTGTPPYTGEIRCDDFDPESKLEMQLILDRRRVPVAVPDSLVEESTSDETMVAQPQGRYDFLVTNQVTTTPLMLDRVTNVKIGATWKGYDDGDYDFDIYVQYGDNLVLYYRHNRNPDGSVHVKDFTSAPTADALEMVDMGNNSVRIEDLKVWVNNYKSPKSGRPVDVTVRLQIGTGEIYSTTVTLPANGGNGGQGRASANPQFWRIINVPALCGRQTVDQDR